MITEDALIRFINRAFKHLKDKVCYISPVDIYIYNLAEGNNDCYGFQDFNSIYINTRTIMSDFNNMATNDKIRAKVVIIIIHELFHIDQCKICRNNGYPIEPEFIEDACNGMTAKWLNSHLIDVEENIHVKSCDRYFKAFIRDNIGKYDNPFSDKCKYVRATSCDYIWDIMNQFTAEWNVDCRDADGKRIEDRTEAYEYFKSIYRNMKSCIYFNDMYHNTNSGTYFCLKYRVYYASIRRIMEYLSENYSRDTDYVSYNIKFYCMDEDEYMFEITDIVEEG